MVRVEHHDRAVCIALCERLHCVAVAASVIGCAVDSYRTVVLGALLVLRSRHFDRRSDELGHDGCGCFVRRELARLAYTAIHSEHRADCGEARHRALRRPQLGRPVCAGAGLPVHAFQDRVGGAGCRRDLRGHLLADLYAPRCAAISLRLNYPAQ